MSAITIDKNGGQPKKVSRKLTLDDFIKQKSEDAGKVVTVGEDGKFVLEDKDLKWTEFNEDSDK